MRIERPSTARGQVRAGWLDSRHTFSFGQYYDAAWMGFGVLRVVNEDRVAPGGGFAPHRHANMEILSYVLDGQLAHRDSSGGGGVIGPGELQWMSAGHGIEHSEYNASADTPVHFLQIWIQPSRLNHDPAYAHRAATPLSAQWTRLASPDGADGSLAIRQDVRLLAARLAPGERVALGLQASRRYWLQIARGSVRLGAAVLQQGDAWGWQDEAAELSLEGQETAEILLFDLPA